MTQGFYAASAAVSQQQSRLNVHANNLANINTDGFKAKKPIFGDLLYRRLVAADQSEIQRGSGSRLVQTTTDFSSGAPKETVTPQNYMIFGRGFFAVRNPETQEIFYTRSGDFHMGLMGNEVGVGPNGETIRYLCTPQGYHVLDQNENPIPMDDPNAEYPVGLFDFVNTDDMQSVNDSLMSPVVKNGDPIPSTGTVRYGWREMSNTDIGGEFAKIVESQRSFSYMLKMIQTDDELESTINGLRG